MAFEVSRFLYRLSCDVRIFNHPGELPIRDSIDASHPSVQELRSLSFGLTGTSGARLNSMKTSLPSLKTR